MILHNHAYLRPLQKGYGKLKILAGRQGAKGDQHLTLRPARSFECGSDH